MKTIGKFNKNDIKITDLYLAETYGHFLTLGDTIEIVNRKLIDIYIEERVDQLFGFNRPTYIVEKEKIDFNKKLPPVTGYAWLRCYEPIKEGHGSHLVMVWLQDGESDPFKEISRRLGEINWEEQAGDFEE